MEFVPNKGTYAAKKIVLLNHNIIVELWFHKHYYERLYLGDANGKREGIDPEIVESLITRSLEHLFLYSTTTREFNFVNSPLNKKTSTRIVLQEERNRSILNVVIETHYLTANRFEITVITAIVSDKFKMAWGQYCIKIHQGHSVLKKFDNGKFFEICSYKFAS